MRRVIAIAILVGAVGRADDADAIAAIQLFERSCVKCHGPDRQKGDLRLDSRRHLFTGDDVDTAIADELIHRVTTTDTDDVMPPPDKAPPVTAEEAALLKRWLAAGAPWPARAHQRRLAVTNTLGNRWLSGSQNRLSQWFDQKDGTLSGLAVDYGDRLAGAQIEFGFNWRENPRRGDGTLAADWDDIGTLTLTGLTRRRYDSPDAIGHPFVTSPDLPTAPRRDWHETEVRFASAWDAPALELGYRFYQTDGRRISENWGIHTTSLPAFTSAAVRPGEVVYNEQVHEISAAVSWQWDNWEVRNAAAYQWFDRRQSRNTTHERTGDGGAPEELTVTSSTGDLRIGSNHLSVQHHWDNVLVAAGHHVSRLEGDASLTRTSTFDFGGGPFVFVDADSDAIAFDRRAHLANLNCRWQASNDLVAFVGTQADWERLDTLALVRIAGSPNDVSASVDANRFTQTAGLRYSPWQRLTIVVDGEFERGYRDHAEFVDDGGVTALDRDSRGISRSHRESVAAHYHFAKGASLRLQATNRRHKTDFRHQETPLLFDEHVGYSAFLEELQEDRKVYAARLHLRRATADANLSYQFGRSLWQVGAQPIAGVTSGDSLDSGESPFHRAALAATWRPHPRWQCHGDLAWTQMQVRSSANESPAVARYDGTTWNAGIGGTWTPDDDVSYSASYRFTLAEHAHDTTPTFVRNSRFARHALSISASRRLSASMRLGLAYEFSSVDLAGNDATGDYDLHVAALSLRWEL